MIKHFLAVFVLTFSNWSMAGSVQTVDGKITQVVSFPKSYGSYSESAVGLFAIYVEGLPKG